MASSAVLTPFSSEIYFSDSVDKDVGFAVRLFRDLINSANGSNPFSLAIVALVRRFGL